MLYLPALRFLTGSCLRLVALDHQLQGLCQTTAFVWGIALELSDSRALPEGMTEFRPNESILPASPMFPCSLQSRDVQRVVSCVSRASCSVYLLQSFKSSYIWSFIRFCLRNQQSKIAAIRSFAQMEQLLLLPAARLAVPPWHVCCLSWGQPGGAWLCSVCAVTSAGAQAPRCSQRGAGAVQG